jgi:sulfate adenylyltransferase large subunit
MEKDTLKLVIVGSVDHGKSTLIGRLLFDTNSLPLEKIEEIKKVSKNLNRETEFAFLLDHLQEEREQGITIDTTQIFFETDERKYMIIDAPGHIEFVKNMITGASRAEAAILIIDAKEGIREQTKRHANILSLIGIKQVIVVFNKMDTVNYSQEVFNNIRKEIEPFLSTIDIKPTFYIPVSALKGDNIINKSIVISWYNGPTVLEALKSFKEKQVSFSNQLIFPVQDVYKIGDKRIFAGRVESGEIYSGQEIVVLPNRTATKVKSIERFNENPTKARTKESIGITTEDSLFIERGSVICQKGKEPLVRDSFFANVFWLDKEEVKEGDKLSLRCATQETPAAISEIIKRIDSSSLKTLEENAKKLGNLEVGEMVIKTQKPIAVASFNDIEELGKFVLIRNENIVAGGIITG